MATADRFQLKRVARSEQREVSRTARQLGVLWTTAEAVTDLISLLGDLIAEHAHEAGDADHIDRAVASCLLVRSAARAFVLEILDIARRHHTESLLKRRRVMELFAFARIVWSDSALGVEEPTRPATRTSKWRDAKNPVFPQRGDGHDETEDKSWETYRGAFNPGQIANALDQLSPKMSEAYDKVSGLVHPSFTSLVMSIRSHRAKATQLYHVDVFDDRPFERYGLVHALKAERIFDAFALTIPLIEGFARLGFKRRPWTKADRVLQPAVKNVNWRFKSDLRHYRPLLVQLEEHRQRMRQRHAKRGKAREAKEA